LLALEASEASARGGGTEPRWWTAPAAGRQPASTTAEPSAPEVSSNDTELSARYLKIERALTQQGFRAKQAAHAVARLRERYDNALSRPTPAELLREALQLLTPELTPAR
jgi:hypothetical protein